MTAIAWAIFLLASAHVIASNPDPSEDARNTFAKVSVTGFVMLIIATLVEWFS